MTQKIEFLFDVGSPTAYLAWSQLPALCERTGAELVYVPVLLGGIFKATGNNPPGAVPASPGQRRAHPLRCRACKIRNYLLSSPIFCH